MKFFLRLKRIQIAITGCALGFALLCPTYASTSANPGFTLAPARYSIAGSYHLGGYTISNDSVPAILNRFHGSFSYSPFGNFDFGIDVGATQVNVASVRRVKDTIGVFRGEYGFSGGAHLKLSTPFYLKNMVALVGIGEGTYFTSKNSLGVSYSGYDGAAVAGLQFRVPSFGFISAGAKLYLIQGTNKDNTGAQGYYSNINNVRGWVALDFLPAVKEGTKGKSYCSAECSIAPGARFGQNIPIQEISFSVSIGWISPRMYGYDPEVNP